MRAWFRRVFAPSIASVCLATLLALSSVTAAHEPGLGAKPQAAVAAAIDAAQLQKWALDLDNDRFAVRKAAQKSLAAAGASALPAVAEAAISGSLERSTRAVNVLAAWADAPDAALSLAALEQLATLKNHPSEAAVARERLDVIREQVAIAAIRELGGYVAPNRTSFAMGGPTPYKQIVIGPQWKGGVEGLRHVAAVRQARTLSLHSPPIDDSAVPAIAECSQLDRIEIYATPQPISPSGMATLRERLPPGLMLDIRGGAKLGIIGQEVQEVVAGSSADKAGVKQGDRIVEFAGVKFESVTPRDFELLTAEIAKAQPGETKSLHVLRTEKPDEPPKLHELSVTFDRWGDTPPVEQPLETQDDPFGNVQFNGPGRLRIPQRR